MSDATRTRLGPAVLGALCLSLAAGSVGADEAHPVVAGFERFFADPGADRVRGGLLLLGELGCTSCHAADQGLGAWVLRKQAPVLDRVGSRVRPEYLRAFLADPQGVKPGTTMPDLFAGTSPRERAENVEALTHFLASTGGITEARVDRRLISTGRTLYHQSGCAVCHGPREGNSPTLATSVPLGDLGAKYTAASLTVFLQDPHAARPSGRMPALNLQGQEAQALAAYLLRDLRVNLRPNLTFRYYEGNWDHLPDFDRLEPKAAGQSEGFDLSPALRETEMAFRFEGTLVLPRDGAYTFHLRSDDGSTLFLDGTLVVDNDGIHAPQEKAGRATLAKGAHRMVAGVFNGGGGVELGVEVEGPGLGRQPVTGLLEPVPGGRAPGGPAPARFVVNPDLAGKGRDLFARVGCASCHQLKRGGEAIASGVSAPPLAALKGESGCLAPGGSMGSPRYPLNEPQRQALAGALQALTTRAERPPGPRETIERTLTAFNCYACHRRDGIGGVEEGRDALFETTQKEMGDEGRIPPPLDGVGAKLNADYLGEVISRGAQDRPYMRTRMPRFGAENLRGLLEALRAVDHVEPVPAPTFDEFPRRVKARGRFLAGGEAYGCIKCHTFKGIEAEGVQAIDMTRMTRRLNRDWFHRYVVDPPRFRPGTRMPTAWPDGKALLKVFDGDPTRQVEAIWQFLSDGPNAAEPYGLGREPMPLVPGKEAVIYRNFIRGAGPRAIGVGYPEKANLAFDANDMRVALIWQGAFIDASRHWSGRGEGFQPPLGDDVVALPPGAPFATLPSPAHPWPAEPSRKLGYRFRGYHLSKDGHPTFRYDFDATAVTDLPEAVAPSKTDAPPGLRRTLELTSDRPTENLWFRAAVADRIEPQADGWFLVNGEWRIRVDTGAPAVVRTSNGKAELLVPVLFQGKQAKVVEQFEW